MERNDLMQEEEDFESQRGPINWLKGIFAGHGDEYEEEEDIEPSAPARTATGGRPLLRIDSSRGNAIYVRKDYRTFQDAQAAADRLKERRPVIVNFEHADPDMARRGVDFISGVVYALDGYYEKIGENVFLFTPSNLAISVEDTADTDRPGSLYSDVR